MAQKFIDAAVTTEKTDYSKGDGTALTLTNTVRVLWDDTAEPAELYATITRIRDAILDGYVPDA